VWDEILKSHPEKGTPVVALAFGPGLTIIGAVFEVT
jgi:predicted naringenin-chalcone synthase